MLMVIARSSRRFAHLMLEFGANLSKIIATCRSAGMRGIMIALDGCRTSGKFVSRVFCFAHTS
jgi:hypothetical protein